MMEMMAEMMATGAVVLVVLVLNLLLRPKEKFRRRTSSAGWEEGWRRRAVQGGMQGGIGSTSHSRHSRHSPCSSRQC
jgi:hypothetical protein